MTVFKEVLRICDSPLNAPALHSHPLTQDRLLVLVFHKPVKAIMRCCRERMNRNWIALVKPQKYGGLQLLRSGVLLVEPDDTQNPVSLIHGQGFLW